MCNVRMLTWGEDLIQLLVFDQEAIVAERGFDFEISCIGDHVGEFSHLGGSEADVGGDPHDDGGYIDTFKSLGHPSSAAADIVSIESIQDRDVRIDIKTAAEFFALIILVGRSAMGSQGVMIIEVLLCDIITFGTTVSHHTDGTCSGEAGSAGIGRWVAVRRVAEYCHTLCFIGGDEPRGGLGGCGDQHEIIESLRFGDSPFDGLESPDGATDDSVDMVDAEVLGEEDMRPDHIADGESWEILIIGGAGGGVDRERSGGAIMRSDDIGTYGEILVRVEESPLLYGVWPPVSHLAIGGEGMTHPRHIASIGIQSAVGVIGDGETRKGASKFEIELPGIIKILDHYCE